MNKKTKITILVIVILLLILIPIGIYASKKIYVHFPTDEEIAQANEEEKNRALAEKEEFSKTHKMNYLSTAVTETNVQDESDPHIAEEKRKVEEREEKREKILMKYYPTEYQEIVEIAKKNPDTGLVDMKNSPLKEHEKRLYDISIKILEEENLTNEEKDLMKDFIKGNMYNIEKDASLLSRAEAVLNK